MNENMNERHFSVTSSNNWNQVVAAPQNLHSQSHTGKVAHYKILQDLLDVTECLMSQDEEAGVKKHYHFPL